jgi:hypothetical protein
MYGMSLGRVDRYPAPDGVPALYGPRPEAATVAPRPDGSMLSPYHTQPEAASVRTMAQYAPDTSYLASHHGLGVLPPPFPGPYGPGPGPYIPPNHGKSEAAMGGLLLLAVVVGAVLLRGNRMRMMY